VTWVPPSARHPRPESTAETCYLRSVGRLTGSEAALALAAGLARPSGRPGEAYPLFEILQRRPGGGADRILCPAASFSPSGAPAVVERLTDLAARLTAPRPPWAGFALDRPLVMGIVNVTPDSFSDGGAFLDPAAAIAHGHRLWAEGADFLDIGGESTRPGATPVSPETETARVVPVIRALAGAGAVVSVDTRRTAVMAAALEAGARIVNDVTALGDAGAVALVARQRVPVVLMHMQGDPQTMQQAPRYDVPALDLFDYFEARLAACTAAGLDRGNILIDPGFGFGKTLAHNVELLRDLALLRATGCGVLLGVSRKSSIGRLAGTVEIGDRLAGSLAAGLDGVRHGADVLRVHDVAGTVQSLRVARALENC
jgi:dihydropteroate synthase